LVTEMKLPIYDAHGASLVSFTRLDDASIDNPDI
jgi:hypothetical protein